MTTSVEQADIAIVGGGMVGASLALLLAQALPQWRILLVEARSLAEETGSVAPADARSSAIAYGSVEILEHLGIWRAIAPQATPILQVHVSDRGHLAGSLIDAASEQVPALGYVVANAHLGQQLAQALSNRPNLRVVSPARVLGCQPKAGGFDLQLESPSGQQTLSARLTVIADGGDSPLRRQLGIAVRVSDYGQSAIIANVEFAEPHAGVAYERFTAQGPVALLPLGGSAAARRSALIWTLPPARAQQLVEAPEAEFLTELQQVFGFRLGRFTRVGQRQAFPLRLTLAEEQVRAGLVLVGNAAHFLHPVAGQGFNLALRDCAALTQILCEAAANGQSPGDLKLLNNYLESQTLDQQLTTGFSDRLVRLFSSSSLPLIALRHLGLISLALVPPLKKMLTHQTLGQAGRAYVAASQSRPAGRGNSL